MAIFRDWDLDLADRRKLVEAQTRLRDFNETTRYNAITDLGYMGQAALPAVPDIVRVAYTESEGIYSALGYICQSGGCPSDAIDVLIRAAEKRNMNATRALKLMGHPRAVDFAIANLKDDSRQGGKAFVLRDYKDEKAIVALIRHEKEMRKNMMWVGRGCYAIAYMGEFAAEPFARMMINTPHGDFDDQARNCIPDMIRYQQYDFLRTQPLREYARRVLKFKDPEVVRVGLWIARSQSTVFEIESLRRISADESFDPKLRESAAHVLLDGERGDPLAVTPDQYYELFDIVDDPTELPALRRNAIKCLGATREPVVVSRLLELKESEEIQGAVTAALAWVGDVSAVNELRALSTDPGFSDRLRTLADAETARRRDRIRAAFESFPSQGKQSRWGNFEGLMKGGEIARPYLIQLMNESDFGGDVIDKLAKMGYENPDFLLALAEVVSTGWRSPREHALQLIEKHDDKRFIPSMIALIRNETNNRSDGRLDYSSIRAALLLYKWSGENYMLNYQRWERWWVRNRDGFPEPIPLSNPPLFRE